MTAVKNVVRLAAKLVGVQDTVENYLSGSVTDSTRRVVEGLVCCFNTVENEVAVDYVPILCEEQVTCENGVVEYASLSKPVAYVVCALNENGEEIEAQRLATGLAIKEGAEDGVYTVRYAVLPSEKGIDDDSDYGVGVFERLLAYGVAAEYCLHKGMYEESSVWEKKYRMAIESAVHIEEESEKRAERVRQAAIEAEERARERQEAEEAARKEAEKLALEKAEEEARKEAERLAAEAAAEEAKKAAEEEAKRLADFKTIKAREWI